MINSIQYGVAGLEVLGVLWARLGIINKSPIKKFSWMQEVFLGGNSKG